ncbi:transposase [Atopobium sp. oral taxon 416]|nr:transposase [Atopobium sp. oral taxon 416]
MWLVHSKRRQIVLDFCDFVLAEWMSHVEAIACDMNADFECAFLKRFSHLDIVYDRFHIVKNFNEKVICKVRKDEQARLKEEGDAEATRSLKHSTYILMSCANTRKRKERDARAGKVVSRGSALLGKKEVAQKGGNRKVKSEFVCKIAAAFPAYAFAMCARSEPGSAARRRWGAPPLRPPRAPRWRRR